MEPPGPSPVRSASPADPATEGSRGRLLLTLGAFAGAIAIIAGAIWIVPGLAGSVAGPAASGPDASALAAAAASATGQPLLTPVPTTEITLPPATAGPPINLTGGRRFATSGAMALLGNDNSLTLVDADGRTTVLAPASDATFAFPAWSPDGTRLAAIRFDAMGGAILVFDAKRARAGEPVQPTVIFRSASITPFYLVWTPDGKGVSFLADEPDVLSLRLAPADGSAPLDGTGPGARIRSGNPFYFDWIGNDRLLAHVGSGADAFLGEIGLDGSPVGPRLTAPGEFRSAVVSRDGTLLSYARAGGTGPGSVVVAARDGSREKTMPVFGTAGMSFDPTGDTLASIGPTDPGAAPMAIPIGPLRLLDPGTGKVRQLLDGDVVSFWWSPDGQTIAAIRVQPFPDPSGSPAPAPATRVPASPVGSIVPGSAGPTIPPPREAHLVFVDVASGDIDSQSVIHPSELFIDQFLTYFDQYALSHRIWAPDSSSLVVPVTDIGSTTRLAIMPRNGDPRIVIEGAVGFWSP